MNLPRQMILPGFASPSSQVLIALSVVLVVSGWVLYQLHQQPWIGARLVAGPDDNVIVKYVDAGSPAEGMLEEGDVVACMVLSDGEFYRFKPSLFEEPIAPNTYAEFNRLVNQQEILWPELSKGEIALVKLSGTSVRIELQQETPYWNIFKHSWVTWLISPATVFVGLIVYVRNPDRHEAALFYLASYCYFIPCVVALLSFRELAVDPFIFKFIAVEEVFFTTIYSAVFLAIFLIFPKNIVKPKTAGLILGLSLLLPLNSSLQIFELPGHAFMIHGIVLNGPVLFFAWYQWFSSVDPKDRAISGWMLLSISLAFAIITPLFVFPKVFFGVEVLPPEQLRAPASIVFFTLAFAIVRYRLFDVDRWWFRFFLWLIGGALVVVFDLALVYVLQFSPFAALSAALVLAGFAYFPLRQWLLGTFINRQKTSFEMDMATLAGALSSAQQSEQFDDVWQRFLQQRFEPAETEYVRSANADTALADHGFLLQVPALSDDKVFELKGKYGGRKLFTPDDVKFTESVRRIARQSRDANLASKLAAQRERQRIMGDLHDTLGARLLTIIHRAKEPELQEAGREAMQTLRETVRFSTLDGPVQFDSLAADLRAETLERLMARDVTLRWHNDFDANAVIDEPSRLLILTNGLRELLNNLLKHSSATEAELSLSLRRRHLQLQLRHDGCSNPVSAWNPGFGILNLRRRLRAVGGELEMVDEQPGWVRLTVWMPVEC